MRLAEINLRVRDVAVSAGFYRKVLGCCDIGSSSEHVCRLSLTPPGSPGDDVIELTAGRSLGSVPYMDSFSLEAFRPEDVDLIHARAVEEGARAIPPRTVNDERHCVVFDPDGCMIEVFAHLT